MPAEFAAFFVEIKPAIAGKNNKIDRVINCFMGSHLHILH